MEQTIGKYKVVREIGKGGMGIVYKGIDPQSQKSVAIKVLPSTMVDKGTVERFNREAHAMSRLKHQNLIEVYEVGMTGGQHFYVMEYIEGETLKTLIKHKGRLPVAECLNITAQITDALACIHGEGMIHRDIKPGNIMMTQGGVVKLMDFGLVQVAEMTRLTVEGSSVGTAEYMSPEQINDGEVDSRSDIYSLGATMYEMLSGKPPFAGESLQAILMKHKYEKPAAIRSLRPEVPAELERIVHKAMAKDLPQRYQRIGELAADIRAQGGFTNATRPAAAGASTGKQGTSPSNAGAKCSLSSARPQTRTPGFSSANTGVKPAKALVFVFIALIVGGYIKRDALLPYLQPLLSKFNLSSGKADLTEEAQGQFARLQIAEEHYARARDFYRQGLLNEAVAEYRQAIGARKDYALYYKELAGIYEANSQPGEALRTWQDMLKYAPSGSYALEAQKEIERLAE